MKKHIGIITNQFPTGSETFIVNKVLGLIDEGYKLTVCADSFSTHNRFFSQNNNLNKVKVIYPYHKAAVIKNILIHPFKAINHFITIRKHLKNNNFLSTFVRSFLIKIQGFDIIHFEFSGIGITHLDCIELYRPARIYVSCRGSAEYVTPLVDKCRSEKLDLLFQKVNRIHCVSEAMAILITRFGALPQKIFINRPAVSTDIVSIDISEKEYSNKTIILSVGRLVFQKGYLYGLIAIRELVKKIQNVEYHIVGSGEDFAEMKFFVDTFNLNKYVIFHGALANSEVKKMMQKADIFLLTSVCEGIANVALEAMAHSLPVVSTKAGGMDEVISNGFNGLLVDCYDYFAIESALEKLIFDLPLRKKLSTNALNTIHEHFIIKKQINKFIEEYK